MTANELRDLLSDLVIQGYGQSRVLVTEDGDAEYDPVDVDAVIDTDRGDTWVVNINIREARD